MRLETLTLALRENSCVVHRIDVDDACAFVVERVRDRAGGGRVAIAPADPIVAELGLVDALHHASFPLLRPEDDDFRTALPHAAVGVTGSALAVAEPATIGVRCAPANPRSISLLPPVHVCIVRASTVVATFRDAVDGLDTEALPSALTWIAGPSRTGDLEMVQTLGVHGPVVVEVVIAEDRTA